MNQSYTPPFGYQAVYNSFQYKDADTLQGSPIQGKFDIYDGSGYLYEMRGQLSYIQGNLSLLREINWIDRQTRAIFAEFSVYNPNVDLIMVSSIMIEFLSSGSILATARFDPLNLFNESGGNAALFKSMIEIAFMIFIVYFMVYQARDLIKRGYKEYSSDFWTFIECGIIVTAWIAFAMIIVRLVIANQVLSFFKNTGGYGYMKLQKVNDCNQVLTYSLGLCASLGTIKSLKILRFNRSISHLGLTLKLCFGELVSFSMIFFLLWVAFVQLMYLVYGSTVEGYSSFLKSMETAFLVMLGKFDTSQFMISNPILGPIIFAGYNVAILFCALNIFISIIIDAFDAIRAQAKENANEFDFYTHVWSKLRKSFRRKSSSNMLSKSDEYKTHLALFPSRINDLVNFILRVDTFF